MYLSNFPKLLFWEYLLLSCESQVISNYQILSWQKLECVSARLQEGRFC